MSSITPLTFNTELFKVPLQSPLDLVFHSLEEVKTAVNTHISIEGYQLCLKRTERGAGRIDGEAKSLVPC